jgi:hypothetical protein
LDALGLATAEEPDRVRIHERHFFEFQHARRARRNLSSQFSKVLRSNSTNQLKSRAVLADKFFNLQGHGFFRKCKVCAVRKYWNNSQLLKKHVAVFSAIADFSARNL